MSSPGLKKLNADMTQAEFFNLSNYSIGLFSSKGSNKSQRQKNEDSCGFVSPTANQVAMIVADGMGGHKMGDKASKMTVNSILGRTTQRRRPFKPAQMIEKIERAHQKIRDLNSDSGSTVVVAVIQSDGLWLYAVGDSLGVLLSNTGRVIYKTFEHSVVGFATESGLLEEKEAQTHDQSNVILNCLGFHDTRLESSFKLSLTSQETVFLCTDGLTELLTIDEVASILKESDFESSVNKLVDKCQQARGGVQQFDDLSLIVCRKK